jgi:hypothetical protein
MDSFFPDSICIVRTTTERKLRSTIRRTIMKEYEKAERLRQCADVSYEEARDALRACGGDILEAMIYLEKLGHAKKGAASVYSTSDQDRAYYGTASAPIRPVPQPKSDGPSVLGSIFRGIGRVIKKSMEIYLVVSHEGVVKFRISVFFFALLLMLLNAPLLIAMVVSLFFGVKYSFSGKQDLSRVNEYMGRAGDRASEWWGGYRYNSEIGDLCRKYDDKEKK